MKIAVCVKQVPEIQNVRVDPETHALLRDGAAAIMNPPDCYALELAVRLKEQCGGKVIVFSMGPPQAEEVLLRAVSCGADDAVLVTDRKFAGSDTMATSYILAKAIVSMGDFDLVVCGSHAIDGDTGQVGPGLAFRLGLDFVAGVQKVRTVADKEITVERIMSYGYDVVSLPLPALLTVVENSDITVRLPSLRGKIRASELVIPQLSATDIEAEDQFIGLSGSPTRVVDVFSPEQEKFVGGAILTGDVDEQVDALLARMRPYL